MSAKAVNDGSVKKWDRVNGVTGVDSGTSPSVSSNYMRGIEDVVEQNDNNFDGIINNVETPKSPGKIVADESKKHSVLEMLYSIKTVDEVQSRKSCIGCCPEREVM